MALSLLNTSLDPCGDTVSLSHATRSRVDTIVSTARRPEAQEIESALIFSAFGMKISLVGRGSFKALGSQLAGITNGGSA